MDYFKSFLKQRNWHESDIVEMMSYEKRPIAGTDDVCRFLHDLPRTTNIGLISDYDTDGLMSEIVKFLGLNMLGFSNLYIGKREISKGYELTRNDIDNLGDIQVLFTSDVGMNCNDAINYAKQKGMTVIITDHHIPNEPDMLSADFVINYRLDDEYAKINTDVCGAFTVYQIFERYMQMYSQEIFNYNKYATDLELVRHFAAIATVADSMPLLSINHHIVGDMLHFMNYINPLDKSDDIVSGVCNNGVLQNVYNNWHIFINALIGSSYNNFDMTFLQYSVIPAINSIKRMASDTMIFYNMIFGTSDVAAENAQQLVELNDSRKELVEQKMNEIEGIETESGIYKQPYSKYIFTTTAPVGVAGLLAVKVMNKTGLPVVILNDEPVYDASLEMNVLKGSVRCPHSYEFLTHVNSSGLAYCSGHECECGISVVPDKLNDLYEFLCHEFDDMEFEHMPDIQEDKEAFLKSFDIEIDYDANMFDFEHDIDQLIDDLCKYAPYGKDFEPPRIILHFSREHGLFTPIKDNQHTKISLAPSVSCLLWNIKPDDIKSADENDRIFLSGNFSKSLYMGEWTANFIAEVI